MYGGGGEFPSDLCGRANSLRDCRANIRHSNCDLDGPRQLWLEVSFQLLPQGRGRIKIISSFDFVTPGKGCLFNACFKLQFAGSARRGSA
jgi:hypothetical protein